VGLSSEWEIKSQLSNLLVELIEGFRRSLLREKWNIEKGEWSKAEVVRTWFPTPIS
jgi:hypothetical protein